MKKLTKAQRAKNKRAYKTIRKYYEKAKLKMTEEQKRRIGYKQFKNRVKAKMKADDIGVKTAAEKVLNSEAFTSPAERSRTNLTESIKESFKNEWNDLRKLSRDEKGRFKKVSENLVWDKERNGYVLGGKYFIDVTNSPEEIRIIEL